MSYTMNKIKSMSRQSYKLIAQWDVKIRAPQFA